MINSLKDTVSSRSTRNPTNSDREEADQELMLLQDIKLQEWYQGDLQGFTKGSQRSDQEGAHFSEQFRP